MNISTRTPSLVVLDVNAYGSIGSRRTLEESIQLIDSIRSAEHEHGIKAIAFPTVLLEMFTHIAYGREDSGYNRCAKSLRLIHRHCVEDDGTTLRLLPMIDTVLAADYFNTYSQTQIDTWQSLGTMLHNFSNADDEDEYCRKHRENLDRIASFIECAERTLSDEIDKYCRNIDPHYTDFSLFVGGRSNRDKFISFIDSEQFDLDSVAGLLCALQLSLMKHGKHVTLNQQQFTEAAADLCRRYPEAVTLRRWFFKQLLQPNYNVAEKSRANFLWDEQIIRVLGLKPSNGEPITLVTNDRKMGRDVVLPKHPEARILTLDEYLNRLNITP